MRRSLFVAGGVLAAGALLLAVSPRSVVYRLTYPTTAEQGMRPHGEAEAQLGCAQDLVAIRTPDEVLVKAGAATAARGAEDFRLPGGGRVEITKPWFGTYQYRYVAADGSVAELEPGGKWPVCSMELRRTSTNP